MSSPITTHVLDTARGCPAAGLDIRLERTDGEGGWIAVGGGTTNSDGRVADLMEPGQLQPTTYRITFEVGPYLEATGDPGFYSTVPVIFHVREVDQHYHVPLLLSPYGFPTYRGS